MPGRGVGCTQEPDQNVETDEHRNCLFIFGCRPYGEVSAVSTVALEFIEQLKLCEQDDGSIKFPTEDFLFWTPGDEGEKVVAFK